MPNGINPQELHSSNADFAASNELLHHPSEQQDQSTLRRWHKRVAQKGDRARQRRLRQEQSAQQDRSYAMLAAVPFWAVAGTTLRNALVLCALLIITLIPSSYLHFLLRRRLHLAQRVALPAAVLVATMLASGCCALMMKVDATLYSAIGIYLFLLAAAPVLLNAEQEGKEITPRHFWGNTLRFLRDFIIVMLFTGAIRELVGYNTLLGATVAFPLRTEAVGMPFFGLILSGVLLAVLRGINTLLGNALFHRKKAESKEKAPDGEGVQA